jgi:hypothetical protein
MGSRKSATAPRSGGAAARLSSTSGGSKKIGAGAVDVAVTDIAAPVQLLGDRLQEIRLDRARLNLIGRIGQPRCPNRHTAKCKPSQRASGVAHQLRKSGQPARFTICNSRLAKRDEEAV